MSHLGEGIGGRFTLATPFAGDFADAEVVSIGSDIDDDDKQEQEPTHAWPSRRKALIGAMLCAGLLVAAACCCRRLASADAPVVAGASALVREHAVVVGESYRRLPDSICRGMQKIRPVFRGVSRRQCEAKCSATVDCGAYMMVEGRDDCVLLAGCDRPSPSDVGTYVMVRAGAGAVDVSVDRDVGDDVAADVDVGADVGEDIGVDNRGYVGDDVDDHGVIVVHHHHVGVGVADDLPFDDPDARVVVIRDEGPPPPQAEFIEPAPHFAMQHRYIDGGQHDHPYDCEAGVDTWFRSWSDDKKNWCCTQYYDGCPDFDPQQRHPYNCRADISTWTTSWSIGKKEYCCHQYYTGCPDENQWEHQGHYDCRAEVATWEKSWGPGKKKYCCESYYNGCPTGPRYDCQAHVLTWKTSWTQEKKKWCCSYHHIGCEYQEAAIWFPQYECKRGDPHGWDERQKAWCCVLDDIGCQEDLADVSFECGGTYNSFQAAWSEIKKAWCCINHRIGCPARPSATTGFTSRRPTTTTQWAPLFDCDVDWAHWMSSWSPEKKGWCCRHQGRGCMAVTTTTPFVPAPRTTTTPFPEFPTFRQTTTTPFLSMPRTTTTPFPVVPGTFDCDAGWANWANGWSDEKKDWCCTQTGRGCLVQTTTTPFPVRPGIFDCEAGWANWASGWSEEKKEWCCRFAGRSCLEQTTTTPFPVQPGAFDCEAGWANWANGWSDEKRQWCCSHSGRGCVAETTTTPFPVPPRQETTTTPFPAPPRQFDCDAEWVSSWSDVKKRWCCANRGKGC